MPVDLSSPDKREGVLVILFDLLTSRKTTYRDRGEIPEEARDCYVLLDGREELVTARAAGRVMVPPVIMRMFPQIFYIAKLRDKTDNLTVGGVSDPIGPDMSRERLAIIKLITQDINLATYLGDEGQILPLSCDTDMQSGSTMEGSMQLNFSFDYLLDPNSL